MKMKGLIFGGATLLALTGATFFSSVIPQYEEKWELLTDPSLSFDRPIPFSSVHFFDKDNGIGISALSVSRTNDGGRNWTDVSMEGLRGIYSLNLTGFGTGWIVGTQSNRPLIMKTTDNGMSWQKIDLDQGSLDKLGPKFSTFYDFCFTSKAIGWIVGDGGIVGINIDGQRLVISQVLLTNQPMYTVACKESGKAWAAGEGKIVLRYDSGWQDIDTGVNAIFKKSKVIGDDIWLLGHKGPPIDENVSGVLLQGRDEGREWTARTPKSSKPLSDLYLYKGQGWLVGFEGQIYHSKNNGITWQKWNSPTKRDLYSIFFLDSNNGWISGDRATILRYQK